MVTKLVAISEIKANPSNPRTIKDDKFKKLVQSIKDFPKMLEIRPIVVNEDNIVLGGNMRLKACIEAGLKKIPVINAKDLTPEEQKQFIIKDNVGFGEWDWAMLSSEWGTEDLTEWGLDLPNFVDNLSNNNDYEGLTASDKLDKFLDSELKRMFFVYESETFERVINWLNELQTNYDLENHSQAILKLMENENNENN